MRLDELFSYVKNKLNKDQSGNITNMVRFNNYLNSVNILMFNSKAGLPQRYGPGQPILAQALEVSQALSEDIRFCLVRKGGLTPVLPVVNGYVSIPDDFIRLSSIRHKYMDNGEVTTRPIDIVYDSEWGVRLGSEIKKPTIQHAIGRLNSQSIEIAPLEIKKVDFSYYRLPKVPYYDFTYVDDNPVYLPPGGTHDGTNLPEGTPSRSVELEWPDNTHIEFANYLISEFSVTIRDQFTYQDSEKNKAQGQ